MATESIKIIDPDQGTGHDYHSLFDWEAGEQGDLVSLDRQATAKCRCTGGTADTAGVTLAGWTTDATRYIKIWTDPAESYRHDGKWNTAKYRLYTNSDSYDALILNSDATDLYIYGLQIHMDRNANYVYGISSSKTLLSGRIAYNIIKGTDSWSGKTQGGIDIGVYDGGTLYVYNNIIYDFDETDSGSFGIKFVVFFGGHGKLYNNTVYNTYGAYVYNSASNDGIAANNISHTVSRSFLPDVVMGSGSGYNSTTASSHLYDTTGITGDRVSQTFTFVNESSRDLHLASNDAGAKGYGTNLSGTFTDDIDGVTRGTTWDIGADQYVAAGGLSIPAVMAHYRQGHKA